MLRFVVRTAIVAVVLVVAGSITLADDTMLKVKEGDKFPVVPLEAAQIDKLNLKNAKTVSIDDLKGKVVVIFFYPKALTKGCTIESCGFRDIAKEFPENVVVIGASGDDMALQQKFIDENKLPFPLLCDTKQELIKDLGILRTPSATMPNRVTFVIDKEGKIIKIYPMPNPATHPKEVLAFVKTLK
jgi:thioredoxin-dependent peroxiredoxin